MTDKTLKQRLCTETSSVKDSSKLFTKEGMLFIAMSIQYKLAIPEPYKCGKRRVCCYIFRHRFDVEGCIGKMNTCMLTIIMYLIF